MNLLFYPRPKKLYPWEMLLPGMIKRNEYEDMIEEIVRRIWELLDDDNELEANTLTEN